MPLFLLSFLSGAKSVVSALLTFFSKPPGSYIGLVIVAGITVWWFGQREFNKGAASVKAQNIIIAAPMVKRQLEITTKVELAFARVKSDDRAATQTRLVAVPTIITPTIDASFAVPCSFVRVFNAANHGPIPDPAACPDDAPSDVALSTVGETETINAGQYDIVANQLIALQNWVQQQEANNK